MKYFILILFLLSCTHKKAGNIIKSEDGKFYRLESSVGDEQYYLIEIDTSAIRKLQQ